VHKNFTMGAISVTSVSLPSIALLLWYATASGLEKALMIPMKRAFYFIASVGHQIKEHFFLSAFTPEQRPRVAFSLACVFIFAGLFFPVMLFYVGVWGIVKYWLLPFIGMHFWMSTFTLVHHTMPHLPFLEESEWTDAQARLALTVHCDYPWLVTLLCHNINVHVPHHVSTAIPSYNLWAAHRVLTARWGRYMTSIRFSVELLRDITSTCHLYDKELNYVPFSSFDPDSVTSDDTLEMKLD